MTATDQRIECRTCAGTGLNHEVAERDGAAPVRGGRYLGTTAARTSRDCWPLPISLRRLR